MQMDEQFQADISVIVPVYNGQRYLAQALSSVFGQSLKPREVIVVDDGSTDESAAVARQFPAVRLIQQENRGQAIARNRGVEESRAAFLAFLDADDLWMLDKLELQMAAMEKDPELDAVFGQARVIHHDDHLDEEQTQAVNETPHLPAYLPGALLIKRAAFEVVGEFASQWKVAEVVDWYARAEDAGLRMTTLDEVVLQRRIHDDNLGVRERHQKKEYARVLKAVLDRRRRNSPSPAKKSDDAR